jgi:hypothetical protein
MGKQLAAVIVLMGMSVFCAYATLGELGFRRFSEGDRPLLTTKKVSQSHTFSLKSNYQFRGSQVIRLENINTIQLNTVMSYRVDGTTYVAPVSRRVAVNLTTQNKLSGATVRIKL